MSSNVFSINHAGAAGPLDGTYLPPEHLPDSAITGIRAVADFLQAARHYEWQHFDKSFVTIYSGVDRFGHPFLLVSDVNAGEDGQAALFRKSSFDDFERAAPEPVKWGRP